MKTPRIEEMVEKKAKGFESWESFYSGLSIEQETEQDPVRLYEAYLIEYIKDALTQAHQAGIDEAVEIINGIEDGFYGKPCCYGHYCCNETGYKQALDDTIKALTDKNKTSNE